MFRQRKNNPVAKMSVKRNQRSLLLYGPLKNLRVVSPRLSSFGRADDIIPGLAQNRRQFDPKHLIKVEAHGGLCRIKRRDFRMQNGMPGILQGSLNIVPRQFRVAAQQ
jgi:hypothetical protein